MAVSSSYGSFPAVLRFTEFQRSCVLKDGIAPGWFHGFTSRKAAEEKLMGRPPGCFLIRVSESRAGYTLSYQSETHCRHFMIDVLSGGQYVIVGDRRHHNSLHDLVTFHQKNPIAPFSQLLTVACEQTDKTKYVEFPFSQRKDINPNSTHYLTQIQVAARSNLSEHSPTSPTLTASPTGLYPCLETELSTQNQHSTEQPIPKLRTICDIFTASTQQTPAQVPPTVSLPSPTHAVMEIDRSQGLMRVCPEKHQSVANILAEDKGAVLNQQKQQQQQPKSALITLVQIKKMLKKKNSQSEDRRDISKEPATFSAGLSPQQSMENDFLMLHENCTTASYRTTDGIPISPSKQLPIEYLNPPPFAPGY